MNYNFFYKAIIHPLKFLFKACKNIFELRCMLILTIYQGIQILYIPSEWMGKSAYAFTKFYTLIY